MDASPARWTAATCLLSAAVVLAVAACSTSTGGNPAGTPSGGTDLYLPGGTSSGAGITQDHVAVGQAVTFGSMMVCGSSIGTQVTSVSLVDPVGDMVLARFALRPNPTGTDVQPLGVTKGTLLESVPGLAPGPAAAAPCVDGRDGSELLVEVTKSGPADACARGGLDIHYDDGSAGGGTLHMPLALGVSEGAATIPCP